MINTIKWIHPFCFYHGFLLFPLVPIVLLLSSHIPGKRPPGKRLYWFPENDFPQIYLLRSHAYFLTPLSPLIYSAIALLFATFSFTLYQPRSGNGAETAEAAAVCRPRRRPWGLRRRPRAVRARQRGQKRARIGWVWRMRVAPTSQNCSHFATMMMRRRTLLPCGGRAVAMVFPFGVHVVAMLSPSGSRDVAMPFGCHAVAVQFPRCCLAIASRFPCRCHAVTMLLPCYCNAIAMP